MRKITFLFVWIVLLSGASTYAQPTTNAPVPTNAQTDVISIYSDSFTNVATDYDPNWGQMGHGQVNPTYDPGTGNLLLAYPNFNYQGTNITTQNASGMEYLHIDIWTNNATSVKVSPINNGTGVSEILVDVPLVQNGWSSVNLPKSAFTGMTWDSVFQIKFDGQGGVVPSTIYLDNVYFWKTATPAGSDASLSALEVGGSALPGFVSSVTSYTYELVVGTTTAPQITSATTTDAGATVTSITQASGVPGTASVLVTSQNGSVTKTYTINFVATFPNQSPTPGTPNNQVLSIYSDTGGFTNVWTPDYNFGTYSGKPDLDPSAGVNEAIKMNFAVAGYGEGTNAVTDISAYQWVHFDYFADSNSNQIRFILIDNEGVVQEYNYELATTGGNAQLVQGSWQSVNVQLSFFEGLGFNKANFFQFKLGTISDLVSDIVYFDNIYFSVNEPFLKTDSFDKVSFSAYPNPTRNEWNINANQNITSVTLFDVSGKQIKSVQPNDLTVSIDASELSNGIYFANILTDNGSKTVKLIKN
ncbi:T9SS type A sorting domain-containing protein [Flavobacterium sp. MAH-1]|uniref:T9SS type A sorting domain-containing protein n=1 Tax=Flavobacterium agri TaxID=2743471 RepID=A0A7Y9C5J3_9FLAO|nr:T9SS type A sorting domain-containing protein [Flavobacterium agri]NUY80434.1 T9SS type A sorting domain-containing protein [Flavobacterium agri]NYA70459.1 T9SS type A sorting domain-containing protein [Flavobacterium agri]